MPKEIIQYKFNNYIRNLTYSIAFYIKENIEVKTKTKNKLRTYRLHLLSVETEMENKMPTTHIHR